MNGKLIVIEGLDGSGKATQARALAEALQAQGKNVMQITFPDYASDSSALVRMYLGGQFGSHPDDVNAYAASAFYSVDRFASYKMKWGEFYREGGIVIADRYTTSNAVHQCSKLPPEQWQEFLDWLFDFEYNKIGIPAPDRVIYLEVDLSLIHICKRVLLVDDVITTGATLSNCAKALRTAGALDVFAVTLAETQFAR